MDRLNIRRSYYRLPLYPLIFVAVLAVYLGAAWFYVSDSYENESTKKGNLSAGETYKGEDFARSLDLSIASKAVYQSSPLNKVRDLGLVSGVHESVVSFSVPLDNLTEYGLMTVPLTKMPVQGYPVIILAHGYYNPNQYSTLTGFLNDMRFYSQNGFIVVKPDFRGQGLSIKQGQPEGAYYSMAYNTDLMSLIASLKQTSYIDKNNINLWGQSMGAYLALRAAVLSPDIKNLILLSGPVGSIPDMYSLYKPPSDADNPVAYRIKQSAMLKYGSPAANPSFWNAASPINYVSQITAYVQIHVGTSDKVVPPILSKQLDEALSKAGKPHEYFEYQGSRHGLLTERNLIWPRSLQALHANPAAE